MKTPRTFHNELYEFLVEERNVPEDKASAISAEAELYAEAYEQYKLRDITFAIKSMGLGGGTEQITTKVTNCSCGLLTVNIDCLVHGTPIDWREK